MNRIPTIPTRRAPRRLRAWATLAVLTLGTVAAAACTPGGSPAGRSFTATVSATATPIDDTHFTLAGTGHATRFGAFDYAGTVEITDVDVDGVITDTLVETLTFDGGATLTIHCEQVADPVSPGVYTASDEWTIVGGTGRFAHASGSGTGETHIDLNTGTVEKVLNGTISLHS